MFSGSPIAPSPRPHHQNVNLSPATEPESLSPTARTSIQILEYHRSSPGQQRLIVAALIHPPLYKALDISLSYFILFPLQSLSVTCSFNQLETFLATSYRRSSWQMHSSLDYHQSLLFSPVRAAERNYPSSAT